MNYPSKIINLERIENNTFIRNAKVMLNQLLIYQQLVHLLFKITRTMPQRLIEDVILFQIDRTSKVSKVYSQKEFDRKNLGITVDQWVLLKIIDEAQPVSQKELANKSKRDPASITRTLDLLEKKEFLIREAIPDNRRQYNIKLTAYGNSFIKKNMKMINRHRKESTKGLSEKQLIALNRMLLKIQENMS